MSNSSVVSFVGWAETEQKKKGINLRKWLAARFYLPLEFRFLLHHSELLICMTCTLFKHYKSMQKSGVWVFLYSFHSSSQNYLISIGKLLHKKRTPRTHISIV